MTWCNCTWFCCCIIHAFRLNNLVSVFQNVHSEDLEKCRSKTDINLCAFDPQKSWGHCKAGQQTFGGLTRNFVVIYEGGKHLMGTSVIQYVGCIWVTFPHCVFSNVSSNCLGLTRNIVVGYGGGKQLMGTSMIQQLPILLAYNGSESLPDLVAGSSLNRALLRIIKSIFYHQLPNSYTYAQSLQT